MSANRVKEFKVQLTGGQQSIDTGFVRGCGTRWTYIKPVEHLADQSASIQASSESAKHTSDLEQLFLSPFNLESIEGILKDKSCVKIVGASESRWCLVQLRWTRHHRDAPKIFKQVKDSINMRTPRDPRPR